MNDFVPTFARRLKIGDVILTGGWDPVSLLIQVGSRSPFSHAAIVTGPLELTEAFDYALTPEESDEGVFAVSLSYFMGRTRAMRRVRILRPVGVDQQRVISAARHLHHHSPGFPSVGMGFLALCGLSGPALRALPADLRARLAALQIRLAGDGIRRMHCAETVIRIYGEAGLALRFSAPRLSVHIDQLDSGHGTPGHGNPGHDDSGQGDGGRRPVLRLPTEERIAVRGCWPGGRQPLRAGRAVVAAVRSLRATVMERARSRDQVDVADLILPGDFARAEPFELAGDFVRTRRGWVETPIAVTSGGPEAGSSAEPASARSA